MFAILHATLSLYFYFLFSFLQDVSSVFEVFYILDYFPICFLGIIGFIIFKILFLSNTIRLWPVIGKIYSEIYFGKTPARLGCKKRIVLKKRKTKGV